MPPKKASKRLTKRSAGKRASNGKNDVMEEDTQRQLKREPATARPKKTGASMEEETTQTKDKKTKGRTPSAVSKALAPDVESAVAAFVEYATGKAVESLRNEFKEISEVPEESGQKAHPNHAQARCPDLPCIDSTRFKIEAAEGAAEEFIHANKVKLEMAEREFIATQAPKDNQLELLWKVVFQEQCPCIIVLTPFAEAEQNKCEEFWPMETGAYKYCGKMFINNKKVEHQENYTVYTLEVLPEGCSNSLVTRLAQYTAWPDKEVAAGGRAILRIQKWMKTLDAGTACIVSSAGAGRPGTFIGIDTAISRLFKGKETKLVDLVIEMRKQRALAVSNELQYLFIYSTVLDYIRAKMPKYKTQVEKLFKAIKDM